MVVLSTQDILGAASAAITHEKSLLESLREINMKFLLAVRDAAKAPDYRSGPALGPIAQILEVMDEDAIVRVSQFPFLLMDLGLTEAGDARDLSALLRHNRRVSDQEVTSNPARLQHIALARAALTLGWRAAVTDVCATLILFGFAPTVAIQLPSLTLRDIDLLAPYCVTPLRPRWARNLLLWQQLLTADAYNSVDRVRGFVMHAVQLTATSHLK